VSKFWKTALFGLTAATAMAIGTIAPAHAHGGGGGKSSGPVATPSLTNNNLTDAASVSVIGWTGAYKPKIASSVAAGATSSGQLKASSTVGQSDLHFRVFPIPGDTADNCEMDFLMDNTTGAIGNPTAAAFGAPGAVNCSVTVTGQSVMFSASAAGH
jgi:hypothetical protein